MSLPIVAIDRLFARLNATYGAAWDRALGSVPVADAKAAWAHELGGFAGRLQDVAWALERLPERCPNVIEFRNLCRLAPAAKVAQLPAPPANPERIRAELAKLGPVARQSLAVGGGAANRAWAKRILERVAAGEHVGRYARESAQVAMGLRAKVSAI